MGLFGIVKGVGKLIGTSKSGTKVYKQLGKDGTEVIRSYKGGSLFKTITKTPVKNDCRGHFNPYVSTGHKIVVKNAETGINAEIKNLNVNYQRRFSQYNTSFDPGIRKEFSISRFKDGRDYDAYYRVSNDNFLGQTVKKYNKEHSFPYYTRSEWKAGLKSQLPITSTYVDVQNYKMPNGNTVTGLFGRDSYISPMTGKKVSHTKLKGHEIAIVPNIDGKVHVKAGYNIIE